MASNEHEFLRKHHNHEVGEKQCSSYLVKRIKAPIDLVWSLVRRFDQPQSYVPFVTHCYCDVQVHAVIHVFGLYLYGVFFLANKNTTYLNTIQREELFNPNIYQVVGY